MRPTALLRNVAASGSGPTPFSSAHKAYVQSLYRRYLRNSLNWCIRRDIWRDRAIEIRAEFERARNIRNPRELARVLEQAEKQLEENAHPDPYKREYPSSPRRGEARRGYFRKKALADIDCTTAPMGEDGTKWERNLPVSAGRDYVSLLNKAGLY